MNFIRKEADLFIPDGVEAAEALARTTHLAIGAHQDDLEIMAYHGMAACFGRRDQWFGGIVVTHGAGSARTGIYADCSDEEMQRIRRAEQRKAAMVGEYAFVSQLLFSSAEVKDPGRGEPVDALRSLLEQTSPEVVYLHNPADKHDTHVAVLLRSLTALRQMDRAKRPRKVYGCEVWRGLDWLNEADRTSLEVDAFPNLAASLLGLFDSQISGGKRYDLATLGRWAANATYSESHAVDRCGALAHALDLTPLIQEEAPTLESFIGRLLDAFKGDVLRRIAQCQAGENQPMGV